MLSTISRESHWKAGFKHTTCAIVEAKTEETPTRVTRTVDARQVCYNNLQHSLDRPQVFSFPKNSGVRSQTLITVCKRETGKPLSTCLLAHHTYTPSTTTLLSILSRNKFLHKTVQLLYVIVCWISVVHCDSEVRNASSAHCMPVLLNMCTVRQRRK